jgi:hypothetical protein
MSLMDFGDAMRFERLILCPPERRTQVAKREERGIDERRSQLVAESTPELVCYRGETGALAMGSCSMACSKAVRAS